MDTHRENIEKSESENMKTGKSKLKWRQVALIVPVVPVMIAAAVVALAFYALSNVCLHITVWTWWCLRGRDVLFAYSDSPIWRDYIDRHSLPYLGQPAAILNRSERKRWRVALARLVFHHFGGHRQFNLLAVVFRPFRRTRMFRFWQPFRDFKHGHPEALRQMENEFFGLIGVKKT